MAPYLATATLGRFDLMQSSVDGVPSYVAMDQGLHGRAVLGRLPAMIRFYASVFGPYPFSAVGAVVDRAPQVGYALETQTKPVFDSMPDEATLAHELRTSGTETGDPVGVAGHLAARRLRDVGRVAVEGAPRPQERARRLRSPVRDAGEEEGVLEPAAGRSRHAREACSTAPCTNAAR